MTNNNGSGNALVDLSNELANIVERVSKSLVRVQARRGSPSTGIVWSANGDILTSDHTVHEDQDITVVATGERKLKAQLVARDPNTDLALLKTDAFDLQPIVLADAGSTRVGNLVLALGNPSDNTAMATFGVVSAIGGSWRTMRGGRLDSFLRSDAELYSGFSGGPLVNSSGQAIAVNSWVLSQGAGFAIPVDVVTRTVEALASGGVKRAFLGVGTQIVALPDSIKSRLGLTQKTALMVVTLEAGGPSETGGLTIGDVLLSADDSTLEDVDNLLSKLTPDRIGQTVRFRLLRGGETREIGVVIGQRK